MLFDITLNDLDGRFRIGDFTQEMPGALEKAWQCAYDEALLSTDGTEVIARRSTCARGLRRGRVAFYFHYWPSARHLSALPLPDAVAFMEFDKTSEDSTLGKSTSRQLGHCFGLAAPGRGRSFIRHLRTRAATAYQSSGRAANR